MKLLDLFCGAGGAGKGYMDAGFDVTGVDIAPQPDYPGTFIQEHRRSHPEGLHPVYWRPNRDSARIRSNHEGSGSMSWTIPTFRQFDNETRRRVSGRYGVSLAELGRLYGPDHYRAEWEDRVVELFEAGATFPAKQWNSLPVYLQRRVLRTPRALKMPGNVEPWKVAA